MLTAQAFKAFNCKGVMAFDMSGFHGCFGGIVQVVWDAIVGCWYMYIPSLLAHSAANKTTNAVSFAVSSVIPTSLDFGIDLDVYGRTKEWLSAQTAESKESEGATLDDQLDVTFYSQPNKKVSPSIEGDNNISDHHSLNWVRKLYPF